MESFKYIKLLEEIYRAYDFFNNYFYQGELNRPVIMISSKGGRSAYGWFGARFWKEGDQEFSEINLSAEHMSRSCDEILETLLHEMAHLKNAQNEIHDCSDNQYHNKNFKIAAEFFGLEVERRKGYGWATTKLGGKARQAIEGLNPDKELYGLYKMEAPKKTYDRYIPLIVDNIEENEKVLEKGALCFRSKKEFVEVAIHEYYRRFLIES